MTNRLELNWNLDGFVDEQRYYCSETPIDVSNLPAPKAILAGDVRTYADNAIEIGKTYFVRVGSVRNSVEKVGDEAVINTSLNLVDLRVIDGALIDSGTLSKTWTTAGTIILSSPDSLNFVRGAYLSSAPIDFTNDFEISTYITIPSSASSALFNIFANLDNNSQWSGGVFSFGVGGFGAGTATSKAYVDSAISSLVLRSTTTILRDVEYKVAFRKEGGLFKLLVNDVIEASTADFAIKDGGASIIGAYVPDSNQRFEGVMQKFKIKSL